MPEHLLPAATTRTQAPSKDQPLVTAIGAETFLNAFSMGRWERTETGYRWQMKLISSGASSLAFSAFPTALPSGSRLTWATVDGSQKFELEISGQQPLPKRSPTVNGNTVILTLDVPASISWETAQFVIPLVYLGVKNDQGSSSTTIRMK